MKPIDKNGDWLYPDEIKKLENKKPKIKDDSEVGILPESMSKSKKYNRSRGNDKYLWR